MRSYTFGLAFQYLFGLGHTVLHNTFNTDFRLFVSKQLRSALKALSVDCADKYSDNFCLCGSFIPYFQVHY